MKVESKGVAEPGRYAGKASRNDCCSGQASLLCYGNHREKASARAPHGSIIPSVSTQQGTTAKVDSQSLIII